MQPRAENTDGDCLPRLHRFMSVMLELAPDVLVPRQETELLGQSAVAVLRDRAPGSLVVDMCCGSGNLALAIAAEIPSSRIWGVDVTENTVALALSNAKRLSVQDRVTIRRGDLFSALDGDGLVGAVDMIVCNPPYISTARLDGESSHLLDAEPREAFDGGPYGISIHQRLIRDAVDYLKPNGWLLFEFGLGQDRQVASLTARSKAYEPVTFIRDLTGMPRVAVLRKFGSDVPSPSSLVGSV